MRNTLVSYYHYFLGREKLKKSAVSFMWLIIDQGVKLVSVFSISVILARSLGPTEFGYYSYIMAFVSVFIPVASAGIPTFALRDLSHASRHVDSMIQTLSLLRLVASMISTIVAVAVMYIIRSYDIHSQLLVFLAMLTITVQLSEIFEIYFQTKFALRNILFSKEVIVLFGLFSKILAILLWQSLPLFFIVCVIESVLYSLSAFILYKRNVQTKLRPIIDFSYLFEVIPQSIPLILSGVAVMVYAKADFLFLQFYLGSTIVAHYAVALGVIEVLSVLPVMMMKSVAPVLYHAAKHEPKMFVKHLVNVYRVMTILFGGMCILVFLVASPLIPFVYGIEYLPAQYILKILSIRLFFVNFGLARGIFVNKESVFRFDLMTNIVGAILNVLGNIILIPRFGVTGAVFASLGSLCISTFVLDIFHSQLRENVKLELYGMISPHKLFTSMK